MGGTEQFGWPSYTAGVGARLSRSRDYASPGSIPFSIRSNVGNGLDLSCDTAPFFDVYGCIIQNQPDHLVVALRIPIASNLALFAALADRRELVERNIANTISRSA